MPKKTIDLFDELSALQPLREIFRYFFDLPLVYSKVGANQMLEVEAGHRQESLLYFEIALGRDSGRRVYDLERLKKVQISRKTLRSNFHGLYDLAVPVIQKRCVVGFLLIGPYRKNIPSRKNLEGLYQLLTGQKAHSLETQYIHFVKVMLGTPKLNEAAEKAMIRLLESAAATFANHSVKKIHQPSIKTLASELPYRHWMASVMGADRFQSPVRWEGPSKLSPWEVQAMGFDKVPNCAFALLPHYGPSLRVDPVESLLLKTKLDEKVAQICRRWRKLASGFFGGTLAMVACVEGNPGTAGAMLAARKLAKRFEKEIFRMTGIEVLVAAGPVLAPGSPLIQSFEAALKNVRGAVAREKNTDSKEAVASTTMLLESKRKLQLAATSLRSEEVLLEGERFLGLALRVLRDDEELRHWILMTLSECLFSLGKAQPAGLEIQISQWKTSLIRCGSASELASMFRMLLIQMVSFLAKPRAMAGQNRMEGALRDLEDTWQRPPKLQHLALRHGYAVAAFSRAFKRHTGCGFHEYVRRRRLKEAEILLKEGRLNMTQVSEYCGFAFLSQFDKAFHDHYGAYPKKWVEAQPMNQ